MIYGYVRVSTDRQDCENQKLGINDRAEKLGVIVSKWIEDAGVSGRKEPEKRLLGTLMKKVKKGDTIIVSELSRLGRSLYMVMRILEHLQKNGVHVFSHKDNFKLDNSIESKVIAFAFSIAAEIEVDMISRRTKEALARKRKEGVVLGRPIGSKSAKRKLDEKEEKIIMYLNKGLSQSAISRMLGCHRLTVSQYIKERGLEQYRKTHLSYMNSKEKRKFEGIYVRAQQKQCDLLDKEILELYKEVGYSLPLMAEQMNITWGQLVAMLKRRKLYDQIGFMNKEQRKYNQYQKTKK